MAFLYIVATPIGNLEDLTFRAVRILKEVDLILCEDTRRTKKLLDYYQIGTPVLSYHQHSKFKKIDYITNLLKEGKNLAFVSDAGTPGISDPGNQLIACILRSTREQDLPGLSQQDSMIKIIPVPGASALICAASISGLPMDKFLFLGFLPTKKKRKKFFEDIIKSKYPIIFYESPHRIIKTLKELDSLVNDREAVVCRELTKKFETIYRGKIEKIIERLEKDKVQGEFVVILGGENNFR